MLNHPRALNPHSIELYQVDAFTRRPFQGNPAGVCLLSAPREDAWMQALAAEMNLSETAFLRMEPEGYRLRWFTPTVEMPLCGHATLATAHVLFETGALKAGQVARFNTLSGVLTVTQHEGRLVMDFPADPPRPVAAPAGLMQALGLPSGQTLRWVGQGRMGWLVELESPEQVRALRPDSAQLRALGISILTATAQGDGNPYHMVSRVFGPGVGIEEDPVTGGAHCILGPFWAERQGRTQLNAFQASARGGEMGVRLNGDRVLLSGDAVTVMRIELLA
ncbi:MAG: PhzF family phenazine biosynthesis protein [Deltaproteobacteria bacterium]|nr:PhzF family phenazine biosynthesis protein [Deltaproteobacteria bacterium]